MNIRRLKRDQRGAVMTEFVIALPVFIVIFIGIANLYKIEKDSVRSKLRASSAMWNAAMDVHGTSDITEIPHGIPQVAGALANATIIGDPTNIGGNIDNGNGAFGLMSNGTEGEMQRSGQNINGEFAVPATPNTNFDYAGKMTSDNNYPDPLGITGKTHFLLFNIAPPHTWLHTRHAGMGIRYGLVTGTGSASGTISGGGSYNFSNGYDVLVSPRIERASGFVGAVSEFKVVGWSRLTAEESDCLSSILEITPSFNYDC